MQGCWQIQLSQVAALPVSQLRQLADLLEQQPGTDTWLLDLLQPARVGQGGRSQRCFSYHDHIKHVAGVGVAEASATLGDGIHTVDTCDGHRARAEGDAAQNRAVAT